MGGGAHIETGSGHTIQGISLDMLLPKIYHRDLRLARECNATVRAHTSAIQILLKILRVDAHHRR